MARRKRRAPPKPTNTEDPALTRHHYKESSILKPVSPSIHSDDWPCFLLSDATVHRRDGSLASQLHVDIEGPFTIRGKLELEKDNERYLVNRHIKTSDLRIQIDSSHAFSVGSKDDTLSVPVVWASGEAGWFEIVPSQTYRRICDEMFQGVCLHYAFLERYEEALEQLERTQKAKKKKKPTLADVQLDRDELLFHYALRAGDGVTLPEARKRLAEHSFFLLSHFPKDTDLYKYLAKEYSSVVQNMEKRRAGEAKPFPLPIRSVPLLAYDYPHREKSSSLDVVDGSKKGRGRPKSSVPKTSRTGLSEVETTVQSNKGRETHHSSRSARAEKRSSADTPVKDDDVIMTDPPNNNTISRKPRESRGEHSRDSAAVEPIATKATNSSGQVIVDALEDVRRQLLQSIVQDKGGQKKPLHLISAKSWQTKAYLECNIKRYDSVPEVFHYHAQYLAQHLGPEWHDTMIYQWAQENATKPFTLTNITETEVNQIVRRVKKAARGSHAEKIVNEASQPEVREYAAKQTPRNRQSGKAAGLRPSTGGKKRLRYEADFEDSMDIDEDGLLKKKYKRTRSLMEDDDEDEDSGSISEDGIDSSRGINLFAKNDGIPMAQLVIRAEKLPSAQPQGPNQTWVCDEPDCGYVVRAADEARGQKLISSHYEEHDKEAQDVAQEVALNRVNLAVQEGTRGRMPINHLLEKIRNIGEKSNRRDEVHLNGHVIPEPIKKTLLI
ncbi:hypothetical protein F5Y14DRAFT_416987 [Nemania sp. NC0429]|nr:hypothetical protein F5Y14DRAFT_416987 [Nemania sp. NC0429]